MFTQNLRKIYSSHSTTDFLGLLRICFFVVFAWWLGFGWGPNSVIGGNDINSHAIIYDNMLRVRGNWWQNVFDFNILGGVSTSATYGSPFLYVLAAKLNLSHANALNFTVFAFQILISFLSFFLITSNRSGLRSRVMSELVCSVIFGFAPALGWRYSFGHQSFMQGLLVGLAFLATANSCARKTATALSDFIFFFCFLVGFSSFSPQTTSWSLLWGLVFLPLFCPAGQVLQGLIYAAKVGSMALIASVTFWIDPVLGFIQGAWARTPLTSLDPALRSKEIFGNFQMEDFLASLFWDFKIMTSSTSAIELSEKHYALGALLLIPCLISFYRKREFKFLKIVFSQVFVLVFVILAYSLELPSFNSLFDFIPIFGLFRIPFRDFLPLALLIPALLLARSEYSFNVLLLRVNWMNFCIAILAVYLCSAFLPIPVELLLVTLLIFDQVLRRQSSYAKFSQDIGLALIVSLVFVSFSCFKQNMTLFTPAADLRVLSENQGIASLARVELTRMHPVWRALSARASGRSSLDGYWLPPKSLAESITWANSQVDTSAATLQNPFQNAYHFNQNDKAFPLLSKLYNIEGQFSGYELSTNSLKTMTRFNLAENGKLLSADSSSPCKDLKGKVTITEQGFPEMLSFEFKSPAQCEVVLPINFYPQFEISKPNSSVTLTKGLGGMSLLRLPAGASSGKVEFSSWSNPLRALFLGEILFFLSFLINRYRKKEGSH